MSKTKVFGAPRMRALCANARELGINVDYSIDSKGKYSVLYKNVSNTTPTAAAACCFVMGMMTMIAHPSNMTPVHEDAGEGVVDSDEIIALVNEDANAVGQFVDMIFSSQGHMHKHHRLFKLCSQWVRKGKVVNGKYLEQARAALLNHYLDKIGNV